MCGVAPVRGLTGLTLSPRRLLGGFAALAAMALLTQVVGFAAFAVAARRLGPEELGTASFALGIALFFAIPANFGLTIMGIRDIAREPHRAREIASEVLGVRVVLSAAMALAMVALTPVLAPDASARAVFPIAAATIMVSAPGAEWILLGRQRMLLVGIGRMAGQVAYLVAVTVLLERGIDGAVGFCWLTIVGISVTAIVNQACVWRDVGAPRITLDPGRLTRRVIDALPFGVVIVAVQVYFSIDSVMLGYLADAGAVGQYAVAYKIPLALYGILNLWSAALYPQAARLIGQEPGELRRQVDGFTTMGLALALPLAAGAVVLGGDVVPALFGAAYEDAGAPFVVLMGALSIAVVAVAFGAVLAAGGDERRYAWGVSLGALANIVINIWAIPAYGTTGAAGATVAAEALVFVYVVRRYLRVVGPIAIGWGRVARAGAATAVMVAALVAVGGVLPVLVLLPAAGLLYFGAAVGLGALRLDDLRALRAGRG